MNGITVIARKELRDAVRSRWLAAFATTFALVALGLALIEDRGGDVGSQGFNRSTAGLINLCLVLVPLLALVLGAGAIAGERERGTLATLLAQPLTPLELLLGKFVGLAAATSLAIALGFGVSGLAVALVAPVAGIGHYLLFVLLSAVLASAMLSIGILISVIADSRLKALAGAVLAWFVLVLFYELGAIAFALSVSSSGRVLLVAVLANPVEAVRILAIASVEPDLDVLGPLGAYLVNEIGRATGILLLVVALCAWIVAPLAAAARIFRTQDA